MEVQRRDKERQGETGIGKDREIEGETGRDINEVLYFMFYSHGPLSSLSSVPGKL